MGSYGGHILPGSFFLMFGVWYTLKYSSDYLKTRSKRNDYFGKCFCCGKLPCSTLVVEGCVKIFFTSVGTLVELFYPGAPMGALHDANGDFTHPMNWQHATMYLFFALSGLSDILAYSARDVVPRGLDRIFGAVALFIEGYLFYFHVDGRSLIDTRCHILLVLAVWPCALAAFLEAFFMSQRMILHILEMFHTVLLIFQGVWFWQVAYILYPPHGDRWDPCFIEDKMGAHDDADQSCDQSRAHINAMFITMFWAWELAFSLIAVGFIYIIVYKWHKWRRQLDPSFTQQYGELTDLNPHKRMNGRLLSEEEEEAF